MHTTALYPEHKQQNAHFVDFHGWTMPVHYGSQIEEHHAVRNAVGVFDVSHMTVVDCVGNDAKKFLRMLLANDVAKLESGQALYSCMLSEQGTVVDDLIAYKNSDINFRLVVNSATRDKDIAWIEKWASDFDVVVTEIQEKCILAVQGPEALVRLAEILPVAQAAALAQLKPFHFYRGDSSMIARTGYTGEQGAELILPIETGKALWVQLMQAGVKPCGLGARDTLRLEAGLNLYGNDMDDTTSPLTSNLAWTIPLDPIDRAFIGREAVEKEKAEGVAQRLVGLVLTDKGVLREGQKVILENGHEGVITSGGFSPTLNKGIALARISQPIAKAKVDIRGKLKDVVLVKPVFVRNNHSVCQPLIEGEVLT